MIVSSNSSKLKVKTMVGELNFYRYWLHCRRCGKGHAPFDRDIDISDEHKITKNLVATICDFGQRAESYEEASKLLNKYIEIKMAPATIKDICETIGSKLFEEEKEEAEYLYENQHKVIKDIPEDQKKGRLYIEADGSFISIRNEGWKEVKLGEVFKDTKIINAGKERHIIVEKDYTAVVGSAEEFKKFLWACAVRNGLEEVKEVVVLGDGAKWVWNIAKELFPEAIFILDYYHFSEHVNDCANVIYPEDEVNKKRWSNDIIDGFMNGQIETTLNKINPQDYEDEKVSKKVAELKEYLGNNKDKLDYSRYRDKGYFIGSGAVESAHKCVIQRRLKQPGMRWGRQGAQAMACLRTAYKSNKWNKVTDIVFGKAC
jgi:hypothetical protein